MDQIGRLFTFGYQKHRTAEALAQLSATHGFETVIDVRFRPWPPRQSIVQSAGLAHVGEPRLGNRLYQTNRTEIVDLEGVEPSRRHDKHSYRYGGHGLDAGRQLSSFHVAYRPLAR